MTTTENPQTAIDERVVENAELEQALVDRGKLKAFAGEAAKKYREQDELVRGMVAEFALEDGQSIRVGRYRISRTTVAARKVAFETNPTSRLTIAELDDEG